jgi:uncharacterized protein (UPF0332 family)
MKSEVGEMLEKARENLRAATLLKDQGFAEIAASRGYYAMFYIAEALLLQQGLHYSSYSAVIAAYGKEFTKTSRLDPKFHQYLIKSQEIRQTSDYGYTETLTPASANQVITWGHEFLAAAEIFLKAA